MVLFPPESKVWDAYTSDTLNYIIQISPRAKLKQSVCYKLQLNFVSAVFNSFFKKREREKEEKREFIIANIYDMNICS